MPSSFVAFRLSLMRPPLAGPQGETWETALGSVQDGELALLRVAALSRLPARCPDDALDLCGQAFELPRYPGETNDGYRARLQNAFPAYTEGGSEQAIIDQLHAYGVADVRVVLEHQNHGATSSRTTSTTYNPGQLIKANDASGNPQVLEMVGSSPSSSSSGAFVATMGQSQSDGAATWAWRCPVSQDANDPGYPGWWYSRIDVVLGGQTAANFGTLAVNKFVIGAALGVVSGGFTPPAVGDTASIPLASGSLTPGSIVYIGQAGYYQVVSGSGPYVVLNLGDAAAAYAVWWAANHTAGQVFAPDVWGAPGQFPNATSPVAGSQQIVAAGTGIIGQTRIGIAIVDDVARQAVKAIFLRWKEGDSYAGRIVLAYDGAVLDSVGSPGIHNGTTYLGKFNGLSFIIGPTTIDGYDRS
jgi:hypothetical protein